MRERAVSPRAKHLTTTLVKPEFKCRLVNHGADWLTAAFRVELDREVMLQIGAAMAQAKAHGRASVDLSRPSPLAGRWRETKSWEIRPYGREGIYLDSTEARLVLLPKAQGEVRAGEALAVGWNLEVVASNDLLQREGVRMAVVKAWREAEWFGRIVEGRLRRVDLCADFVGFDFDPEADIKCFVKRSRSKVRPYRVHGDNFDLFREAEVVDDGRNVLHLLGTRCEGVTVSAGNPVALRIYDKTQELRMGQKPEKTDVLRAVWLASKWMGEKVDRVEFQVRGEALDELGMRAVTEPALVGHLDTLWYYLTVRWFRLAVRTRKELSKCPNDPRWDLVQAVEFTSKTLVRPDVRRVRRSFGARAAQAIGCAVSLMVAAGEAPDVAREWVTPDGEVWDAREQCKNLSQKDAAEILRAALSGVFRRAGEAAFRAALDKYKSPQEALEHFMVRYRATRARLYVPGVLPEAASTEKGDPRRMRGRWLPEPGHQRLRLVS